MDVNKTKEEEPYIEETHIEIVTEYKYNPKYGDDRICECGHSYYRHFDTYENMFPIGCKYCQCGEFKENKIKTDKLTFKDITEGFEFWFRGHKVIVVTDYEKIDRHKTFVQLSRIDSPGVSFGQYTKKEILNHLRELYVTK